VTTERDSTGDETTPRRRTTRRQAAPKASDSEATTVVADGTTTETSSEAPKTTRQRKATKATPAKAEKSPKPKAAPRKRASRAKKAEEPPVSPVVEATQAPRLLDRLRKEVGPALVAEFGYTSPMQIPRPSKVVLNIGLGESLENARAAEAATGDLTMISGQRPVTTRAKKSIAGFKIREGMPIGLAVTLRGRRMYEFLDRLINSALPRIRDFQGLSRNAFDGRGNYAIGIREQVIFPEIDYNAIDRIRGLQVVIATTARTDREGLRLLELLGMPFTRDREPSMVA